jgi:ribose 5-phosphate isomerase RpiB
MRRRIWLNIISVGVVIICSAGIGALMKADSSNGLIVAVVSLSVALLALYKRIRNNYRTSLWKI